MELPKLIDSIYRDENSTLEMTEYAHEVALGATVEQGYNPDTHPVVQKLARRALALEEAARQRERDSRWNTSPKPKPARKKNRSKSNPMVDHIVSVGRDAGGYIPHEETLVGIPVIVDTKTNIVLPPSEVESRHNQSV